MVAANDVLLFFSPDPSKPAGGVKQIYRHASILLSVGIDARVLHTTDDYRYPWFASEARLAYTGMRRIDTVKRAIAVRLGDRAQRFLAIEPDLELTKGRSIRLVPPKPGAGGETHRLSETDLVILPEFLVSRFDAGKMGCQFAVLNQNGFNTFRSMGTDLGRTTMYQHPRLQGVVTVSEQDQNLISYLFPSIRVMRVRNGISDLFGPPQDWLKEKRRQIAFMPRKLERHIEHLVQALHARGVLDGWSLVPITGMNEGQVAQALRESMIYVSTSVDEGFGLPPVEAGMSGCVVVGYPGGGGREYFRPDMSDPVPQNDVFRLIQAVEAAIRRCEQDPKSEAARALRFAEYLRSEYSAERERESVLNVWTSLIDPDAHQLPNAAR